MKQTIWTKCISSLLVLLLIFTSIPLGSSAEMTAEKGETVEKEATSNPNQSELSSIKEVTAPPFPKTEPKEVTELRTETSKTIDNGDGTYSVEMFQEPIFRKQSGNWKEIQTKIKKQKAGKLFGSDSTEELATANTLLNIQFSLKLTKNKYAALTYKGHYLSYTFKEASGEKGTQKVKNTKADYEDNKIFYKEAIPGLTLRNIVFDDSVKEDIILSHYNGTNNYHFFIETDLTGNIEEDGSITFKNQKNETIFQIPKPFMNDSNINPVSAESVRSEAVHYELNKEKKGYAFTVVADEAWLKDPDRVYPVYIDPTTKVQANQDAFVSSAYQTTNYNAFWDSAIGAYTLKVGNYDATTGDNFAYVKMPTPDLQGATIETAIFNIYNIHSYYPTTKTGIWLDRVNGPWDQTTITWKNKPASSLFTSTSVHKGNWATFNVKNAVNDWVKGATANHGFKLHTNGNNQTYWKKFYASEHHIADYRPHLNIAYSYPSPSNLTAKTYSLGDGTGYIDLNWNAVAGASSYLVWIFDGNVYQPINVGKTTNWSTKDKSVWPQVGANLPVNPQSAYRASGGTTYNDRTNYAITVSAVFANGESQKANPVVATIPSEIDHIEFTENDSNDLQLLEDENVSVAYLEELKFADFPSYTEGVEQAKIIASLSTEIAKEEDLTSFPEIDAVASNDEISVSAVHLARIVVETGRILWKAYKIYYKVSEAYVEQAIEDYYGYSPTRFRNLRTISLEGSKKTIVLEHGTQSWGMEHIMAKHHPKFYTGVSYNKKNNTYFPDYFSFTDIENVIITVANYKDNKDEILKKYRNKAVVDGYYLGKPYRLVVTNGSVTTLYPLEWNTGISK